VINLATDGKRGGGNKRTLLVNCFGDAAMLSLVHAEYALIDTAGGLDNEGIIR